MSAATAWIILKKAEKDGDISEDDQRKQSDRVQKMTDETIARSTACCPKRKPKSCRSDGLVTCRSPKARTMATPAHVAIIMDGNGRWAKARGLPRLAGHRAGVEALRKTRARAPASSASTG